MILELLLFSQAILLCRSAISISMDSKGKWNKGVIPYRFDEQITDFGNLKNILIAMQQLEEFTAGCIKFTPHGNQKDFIIFQEDTLSSSSICFSYVGKTGKWQPVRLSSECTSSPGHVMHLLTRVVGLYPESNRPDRDNYIALQWDNITPDKLQDYAIIPDSNQVYIAPGDYDFGSITHFTQHQFSRNTNNLETWLLKQGVAHPGIEIGGTIGQREGPSVGDIEAIRKLYNCSYPATVTPEFQCKHKSSQFSTGVPAGWLFCKCHVNQQTGQPYFTGKTCNTLKCSPSCSSYSNCAIDYTDGFAQSSCKCKSGRSGSKCEQFYCSKPCRNGGVCVSADSCRCPRGFTGKDCTELSAGKCKPGCMNGGECLSSITNSGMCKCQPGWAGKLCDSPICNITCLNGGKCVAPNFCECPLGYTGLNCGNSNITFGLPCTNDYDCQKGWGDKNSFCNLISSCPGVSHTCVCKNGFERLPSGGPCRVQRKLGEKCSWLYDVCKSNSECIEGKCQCNYIKGWVAGPLNDCVKSTKSNSKCSYWDDCLYNLVCTRGSCQCPTGMTPDSYTKKYTCRPKRYGEKCSKTSDCKYVGVGAICTEKRKLNGKTEAKNKICDCKFGVAYEFLVDRYTIGKTCLPPYPQKWGEHCSVDFVKTPQYGPCERGLVCELCPRTNDEYRCQNYIAPLVGKSISIKSVQITYVLLVTISVLIK